MGSLGLHAVDFLSVFYCVLIVCSDRSVFISVCRHDNINRSALLCSRGRNRGALLCSRGFLSVVISVKREQLFVTRQRFVSLLHDCPSVVRDLCASERPSLLCFAWFFARIICVNFISFLLTCPKRKTLVSFAHWK